MVHYATSHDIMTVPGRKGTEVNALVCYKHCCQIFTAKILPYKAIGLLVMTWHYGNRVGCSSDLSEHAVQPVLKGHQVQRGENEADWWTRSILEEAPTSVSH